MECCKRLLGINFFGAPPWTLSTWIALQICCTEQMAAIFQNGRHSKLYLTSHSNLDVTISQPVLHKEPSYLCIHPCFGGQRIHWNNFLMTKYMLSVKWRPFWKMAAIQNYIWPAIQTLMWPYLIMYCTKNLHYCVYTHVWGVKESIETTF